MNIAIPGSIMCRQGFVFQDSEFLENINSMFSNIEEACFHCSSKEWPKFYNLPMEDVWKWATGQKDFNGGFSNSQIGRALNSYSYLFGDLNREYDLFWAMQGIESLYLNGEKLEITSKLNTRIQLFIGDIKIDKKLIKKMYDFRSQFVHGSRNIIRSYCSRESEKFIKSDIEYYHTECIAEGILLATFQELVKRNYSSLSFSTIVNSPKNQPNLQFTGRQKCESR